jgi:hypothetical protein
LKQDSPHPDPGPERGHSSADLLTELIRRHSRDGKLISGKRLEREIATVTSRADDGLSPGDALNEAIRKNPDLGIVYDANRHAFYHSVDFLSHTYAGILALKDTPARMMADTIRDNSARYPRPMPLDLFEQAPFHLSPEIIKVSLQEMASENQYRDIAATTSSGGTVYLYSSDFLSHDYATHLAEWEDVGYLCDP